MVDKLPSWFDAPALGTDMVGKVAVVGATVVMVMMMEGRVVLTIMVMAGAGAECRHG